MEHLLKHIRQFYPLSNEVNMALVDCFEEKTFTKNDFLLKENQVCRNLYFLQQGALRGYYLLDGKEITHWFAFENAFVTSFHSFITGKPSVENLQFLEGSVLWSISKEKLEQLYNRYHEIERLVRIVYERYYILLEERYVNGHFKTAWERYRDLLHNAPHILERVPLGHVSSYLGITQETLSRVRKQH
ncbi:MAG TPA: Crp/Fnr family transcriptional regulator [Flavipsychrobacter sp.]|nr:Crp/Fnr family transcriptional regulator [Flavipsychrobacter sp.]